MKLYNKSDLKYSRIFFDKEPPRFIHVFILISLLLFITSILFATFVQKQYIVKGYGSITDSNIQYVATKSAGVVSVLHKKEGENVAVGEPLFSVSNGEEGIQISALKKQLSEQEEIKKILEKYRQSLDERKNYLSNDGAEKEYYGKVEYYLLQLENEERELTNNRQDVNEKYERQNKLSSEKDSLERHISNLENQLKILETELSRNQTSFDSNSAETTSNLDKKNKLEIELNEAKAEKNSKITEIESVKNEIKQLERNGISTQGKQVYLQLVSELGNAYNQLDKTINDIKSNIQVNEKRDSNYTVYATNEGIIHYQTPLNVGMSVQNGQVIAEISKHDEQSYFVEVYVPTTEISKIKIGQDVDILVIGVNTQKYGTISGTVQTIDTGIVTQRTEQGSQNFYRINVSLNDKELVNGEDIIKLVLSMPIEARIVYDKETYFEWLLEQLSFKN